MVRERGVVRVSGVVREKCSEVRESCSEGERCGEGEVRCGSEVW